jgi:hypothetical protein
MKSASSPVLALAMLLVACSASPAKRIRPVSSLQSSSGDARDTDKPGSEDSPDETAESSLAAGVTPEATVSEIPVCRATTGRTYKGFGDTELAAGRAEVLPGTDRYRVKPIMALSGDLSRVIGSVPPSLAANRGSFSEPPERWYEEPKASAVTIYTTYRIAYEAGLIYAESSPELSSPPTEQSAASACASFARLAWQQEPTAAQIDSCKKVALVDTAGESDVKARWAYALASILTATEFVSY